MRNQSKHLFTDALVVLVMIIIALAAFMGTCTAICKTMDAREAQHEQSDRRDSYSLKMWSKEYGQQ